MRNTSVTSYYILLHSVSFSEFLSGLGEKSSDGVFDIKSFGIFFKSVVIVSMLFFSQYFMITNCKNWTKIHQNLHCAL